MPGLAAKDVIDPHLPCKWGRCVQITVAALDEVTAQALTAALTAIGYRPPEIADRDHRPPGAAGPEADWAKLYFHAPAGQRRTHLHVRARGRPNQRYALLFRDYLRAHPATAAAYAELKRRLAAGLADPDSYPVVKDPAVDLIYLAAEEWAARTDWLAWRGAPVTAYSAQLLQLAGRAGRMDLVRWLLANGAEARAAESGIFMAVTDLDILRLLLEHGASPTRAGMNGFPPLVYVARGDKAERPETAALLLE